MNMQRRKRMQSEYKKGLVADLIAKKQRAATIGHLRDQYVSIQVMRNKPVQNQFYEVADKGVKTL
jgi:hypothetical protein